MFHPSDGLTPIQIKKLNQNFQRLLEIASGKDENNESIVKTATIIQDKLQPLIMDAAYPIGCVVLAKDELSVPAWGKWREVTQFNNRYIRLGTTWGSIGGSSNITINPSTAPHTHTYLKQVADKTIKVDESTKDTAKSVISTLKDSTTPTDTSEAGDGQSQTVAINPSYVTLRMFERYE